MSEQPTIEGILPLIAAPGRYCAVNESGAIMVVLANHIKNPQHGSLLVFFVIRSGMIKGFKIRIDTAEFELAIASIMSALMQVIAIPDDGQRELALKQRNIYPVGAIELWDLIGRQEKSNYNHLRTVTGLSKSTRLNLSTAMYRYIYPTGMAGVKQSISRPVHSSNCGPMGLRPIFSHQSG